MTVLESEYPIATFIYMTGNAQATGSQGYNRYMRNEMIRDYYINKVLFDLADLDAWWYNPSSSVWEQNTYIYDTLNVPVEHTEFNGNESGHTTYTSCEQKGRAVWYMMAKLAGWENVTNIGDEVHTIPEEYKLEQNCPNPFNPSTTIIYTIPEASEIVLELFDIQARKIKTQKKDYKDAGSYKYKFDAENLSSGIYLYRISTKNYNVMNKMLLVK